MKKIIYILTLVFAAAFAACGDKDDIQESKDGFIIEPSDDDSTYVMNFCIGKLIYDTDDASYEFIPDIYYGDPFHSGYELSNTLRLKSIPDTLKAYTDSTLVISGTYTPVCTKTQKGTNCPLIENVFDAEITWAAPYTIIYDGYGCDTEESEPQDWFFDKTISKIGDKPRSGDSIYPWV